MNETANTNTLEVALHCAASLGRILSGNAYTVRVWDSGSVEIQGNADEMSDDLPGLLGLERNERRDHTNRTHTYEGWIGKGSGPYSDITIELTVVTALIPADCEAVS